MREVTVILEVNGSVAHTDICGNCRKEIYSVIENIKKQKAQEIADGEDWIIYYTIKSEV